MNQIEIANYIITQNQNTKQSAKHFQCSENTIKKYINKLEQTDPFLYETTKNTLAILRTKEIQAENSKKIANYILEGHNLYQTMEKFQKTEKEILISIASLEVFDQDLFEQIKKQSANKTINTSYAIKVANYIIDNKTTLEDTAKYYNIELDIVNIAIEYIKNNDEQLYNKVITSLYKKVKISPNQIIQIATDAINSELSLTEISTKNKITEKTLEKYISMLQAIDNELFEKLKNTIKNKESQEENKKMIYEIAKYILSNKTNVEAAKHFECSVAKIKKHIKSLEYLDLELYIEVKDFIMNNKASNEQIEQIARYIITKKQTYSQTARLYKETSENIAKYMRRLKDINKDLYDEVKYVQDTIIQTVEDIENIFLFLAINQTTAKEAANYFTISEMTISSKLPTLKKYNKDLYELVTPLNIPKVTYKINISEEQVLEIANEIILNKTSLSTCSKKFQIKEAEIKQVLKNLKEIDIILFNETMHCIAKKDSKSDYIKNKSLDFAYFVITHDATITETSKNFKIPKTTVHEYLTIHLQKYNYELYLQIKKILQEHKSTKTNPPKEEKRK